MEFNVKSVSNLTFNVFDVNNQDMHGLLNEIDPDNYFTEAVAQTNLFECKYYDEDSFIDNVHQLKYNSLSMFHLNIRSCNKNLPAIEAYLQTLKFTFDVTAFTETWSKKKNVDQIQIENYNH